MKRFIRTEHQVNAPLEKVWAKIAQGDGVENWIPIIKSSKLDGGNRRLCEMIEGGDLEETILASEVNKTFMYSIDKQEAFPASDITGTIKLADLGEGKTQLNWDLELDVDGDEVFSELRAQIEQIYQLSAAKLSEVA